MESREPQLTCLIEDSIPVSEATERKSSSPTSQKLSRAFELYTSAIFVFQPYPPMFFSVVQQCPNNLQWYAFNEHSRELSK